jgi:hypothetical protein
MSECEHCTEQCDLSEEEKGVLDALSALCQVLANMRDGETVIRMLLALAIQTAKRSEIAPDDFVDMVQEELLSVTAPKDNPEAN